MAGNSFSNMEQHIERAHTGAVDALAAAAPVAMNLQERQKLVHSVDDKLQDLIATVAKLMSKNLGAMNLVTRLGGNSAASPLRQIGSAIHEADLGSSSSPDAQCIETGFSTAMEAKGQYVEGLAGDLHQIVVLDVGFSALLEPVRILLKSVGEQEETGKALTSGAQMVVDSSTAYLNGMKQEP
jgi:hypothetical protein